jgi:phosphomannomutase
VGPRGVLLRFGRDAPHLGRAAGDLRDELPSRVVDGDQILYLWGSVLMQAGALPENRIVATVMSNLGFERAWRTISFLLFHVSGVFFMVDWLPSKMQEWILWVPMVHGVEMLRGGYYGPTVPTHYDFSYFAAFNAVLLLLGLLLVDRYKHSVVAE